MIHIKKINEFVNEMARYSYDRQPGFQNFTSRIRRFNNFELHSWLTPPTKVFPNNYDKFFCLLFANKSITTGYKQDWLPVIVWNHYEDDYTQFVRDVQAAALDSKSTNIVDVLDYIGKEYEYDVKFVIKYAPIYNESNSLYKQVIFNEIKNCKLSIHSEDDNPAIKTLFFDDIVQNVDKDYATLKKAAKVILFDKKREGDKDETSPLANLIVNRIKYGKNKEYKDFVLLVGAEFENKDSEYIENMFMNIRSNASDMPRIVLLTEPDDDRLVQGLKIFMEVAKKYYPDAHGDDLLDSFAIDDYSWRGLMYNAMHWDGNNWAK